MNIENLRSCSRKKYQRAMNQLVRKINKSLKDDWLWNARFTLKQQSAYFWPYEDHSGGHFLVWLTLVDNKTGAEEYMDFDNYGTEYRIMRWINICITEYFNVWKENPDPYKQAEMEGRYPVASPDSKLWLLLAV